MSHAGPEIQKIQEILRQRYLKDSFSKRKLWSGAPKLAKFNRRFGIVHNVPLLSELDYTSCYEMMDQFPSEIKEVSVKSMLNMITQTESRIFIFKGPPGCGKTELISRVCRYWAKNFVLRSFSLVLYINVWHVHASCTLLNLIDRQFKSSTVSSEKICHWIEEVNRNGILFILDGFCHKYLHTSPLQKRGILSDILSGHSSFSKSKVVISTTCSDFVKPLCENFTQFEILGLSDEQLGKQVIQHLSSESAFNFLSYLAGNPEIKGLVSSPSYLIGTVYVFAHLSYNDLPMAWTELYISLVVLVNKWHKREPSKDFLLQAHLKRTLLKNGRKGVKDSGYLLVTIGKSLIHDADEFDHVLPDHNSAMPYLEYFLDALETLYKPDDKKRHKAMRNKNRHTYYWYFLAGLGIKTDSQQLLKQYYQRNVSKMTNCLSESGYMTAEQQAELSFLTAKVSQGVVTTHDIHSILHCLPYMQDPHRVALEKCLLGAQAMREFSKFLAANSWRLNYSGIKHLW